MINYHLSSPHLLAGTVGVDALISRDRRAAWACGVTTCARAGVRVGRFGRVRGREVHQERVILIISALDTYLCFLSRRTEGTCRSGYSMCLFTIVSRQAPPRRASTRQPGAVREGEALAVFTAGSGTQLCLDGPTARPPSRLREAEASACVAAPVKHCKRLKFRVPCCGRRRRRWG